MSEDNGVTVYDGTGMVAGRLATRIAKQILNEERVVVVNADKVVVTGTKERVIREYRAKRNRGKIRKGPYYPRQPHMIFKRVVRGMVPYRQPKGRAAHKRLICHIGVPEEFEGAEFVRPEDALPNNPEDTVSMADISRALGYNVKEA